MLRDLQRVIDELAFGVNNTQQPVGPPSRLIVEQVPALRTALLRRGGWEAVARSQAAAQFGAEAQRLSQQRLERMLASFELMCGMEEGGARQQEVGGQSALHSRNCLAFELLPCVREIALGNCLPSTTCSLANWAVVRPSA